MNSRPPILSPAFGLLMMLGIFSAHFIRPIAIILPYPLNYTGLLPIALGVILSILAEREFRRKGMLNEHGQIPDEPTQLITSGIYRFSRNPAFLGQVFILAGIALWVGSVSPWLVVMLSVVILQNRYIRLEESLLAKRFGDSYRQYCALVPRWFVPKKSLSE